MYDHFDIGIKGLQSFGMWIAGWPPTLIGVLLGSFFTLLGVVLTNRNNLRNLRLQLEHDRRQKRTERILATRRDIYLKAAEAIAAGMESLLRLSDLSRDHAAIMAGYSAKSDQIAKIHVIATEKTALRFVEFMHQLGTAFMEVNIRRAPLVNTRSTMLALLEQAERSRTSADHHLELMKQFNLDGTMDSRRMDNLQQNFRFDQDAAANARLEHDKLLEDLRPKCLALLEYCQQEYGRLSRMLLPLLESVRCDLDNPINVAEYEKVFAADRGVAHEKLKILFGINDDKEPPELPTNSVAISPPP